MTRHKYSGCILRKPVAAYSFQGDYRNIGAKTYEQNIEISQEHVEKLLQKIHLVPICTEHGSIKVGVVTHSHQKPDGSVWVDFEIDDESISGNTAHQLVNKGIIKHLSLNHDWNDLQPIEVSLTFKPGREGTDIVLPQHNNSQQYIQPQGVECVSNFSPPPSMMAANADFVAATSTTTPQQQAAPTTQTPATEAAPAADNGAFDEFAKQFPGLANLPEHHKLNLKHIIGNNMLNNKQREEMIDNVMKSIKAEQDQQAAMKEQQAALKEKENELRKLQEENSRLNKDRQNGRQHFHTLVENLVKNYAPQLVTDEFSANGKQFIQEDPNRWIDHVQPAMMACNAHMIEQKSKQQEAWIKKLEVVSNFMSGDGGNSTPAMVQANYSKLSGGQKRSVDEMMSHGSAAAAAPSTGTVFDKIPMSAESRAMFAKWGSQDYGMDIRASDIGIDAKRLALMHPAV